MKVNINKTAIVIRKNITTEFFKDKFKNNFILLTYKIDKKNQLILVRLLGFEPRTSWSVAKRSIQLSYRRIRLINFLLNINLFNLLLEI